MSHFAHAVLPVPLALVPTGHGSHGTVLDTPENVPAGQVWHPYGSNSSPSPRHAMPTVPRAELVPPCPGMQVTCPSSEGLVELG